MVHSHHGILGFCTALLSFIGIGFFSVSGFGGQGMSLASLAYFEPAHEVDLQGALVAATAVERDAHLLNRDLRAADIRVALEDYRRMHGDLG